MKAVYKVVSRTAQLEENHISSSFEWLGWSYLPDSQQGELKGEPELIPVTNQSGLQCHKDLLGTCFREKPDLSNGYFKCCLILEWG